MKKEIILQGEKQNSISCELFIFENLDKTHWQNTKVDCQIPDGFMFLAGVSKYPRRHKGNKFRFGKESIFVQNFLPHSGEGIYRTREYGALYSMYEPESLESDDIVLSHSSIYQSLPDDRIRLVLADGEHRIAEKVKQMFDDICQQRHLSDFSPKGSNPALYQVTFRKKSCGYFLLGRTYQVWGKPIGIADHQSGEVSKGWLFCDINCGLPAIIKADREEFIRLPDHDGAKVGIYTVRDGNLVFEDL